MIQLSVKRLTISFYFSVESVRLGVPEPYNHT